VKNKKGLVFAAILMLCFTTALFPIIPTRSEDDKYNSRLDSNNEEVAGETQENSAGNVTNWSPQYSLQTSHINISWTAGAEIYTSEPFYAGGYSRMSILVCCSDMSQGDYTLVVYLDAIAWCSGQSTWCEAIDPFPQSVNWTYRRQKGWFGGSFPSALLIETKAPFCRLNFEVKSETLSGWAMFDLYVYFRNE
jgi:hypothetical protein